MKFMTLVKGHESAGAPPQELMEAIAKLGGESAKAGKLLETAGLYPSAMGARVRITGGRLTVTDGPFSEAKEVVGGYAIFRYDSKAEAIEAATKFMELHKKLWPGWEGETEIRQVFDAPEFAPEFAPGGKR